MIAVSIIIVNYNTYNLTKACIDSIQKHTKEIDYEIILVDNDSSDGSKEYFKNNSKIIFIESNKNLGFGKANNLGYEKAKGKYIFLLNSDTLLKNNAIKIFFDTMEKMPSEVACIGTILRNLEMKPINSFGNFPKWYDEFTGRTKRVLSQNKVDSYPATVDYITGADLFIRKEVIDKIGLFDPDFFLYYEETEMQKRYYDAGYKSMIIKEPLIIHLEGASSSPSFKKVYIITQSYLLYFKKHLPKYFYFFFRIMVFLKRSVFLHRKKWQHKEKMKYLNLLIKGNIQKYT